MSADQVLFISDLHLCSARPEITQAFLDFLRAISSSTHALYILGDLFEYWAGDDDLHNAEHKVVIEALKSVAAKTPTFFMRGNRDFLIGQQFQSYTGIKILHDPAMVTWFDYKILLSHGDMLCTDDEDYQTFRQQVRNADWQQQFLAQPLADRKAQINQIRQKSEQEKSRKSLVIMDVNTEAVKTLLSQYGWPDYLVHGHTHRPDTHLVQSGEHASTRIVLGDWYEQGSYLKLTQYGFECDQL